jgi:hypothetical protein
VAYPLLYTTTPQSDPGLTHTTAISNVTELQAMTATGNYYLTGNIDASATSGWNGGAGFIPIGTSGTPFIGTFDGQGYTISNLHINRNSWGQSLFGYVSANAAIANVTLSNVTITGGGYYCGALAGYVEAGDSGDILIQNCHASGVIACTGSGMGYYGGLIGITKRHSGDSGGTVYVYDSDSSCTLDMTNGTAYSYRGGLIGYAVYSYIWNCHATGDLANLVGTGQTDFGGLIGYATFATISYCYATGDVEGDGNVGGLIGTLTSAGLLSKSYATGNVNGNAVNVGGLIGILDSGVVGTAAYAVDCFAAGDVNGLSSVGGLCGSVGQARDYLTNCYSIGAVTGNSDLGGLTGSINAGSAVSACFWDIQTSGMTTTAQDKGEGKITKWFRKQKHFTDYGWDFATVWYLPKIGQQVIQGRPRSSYPIQCPHTAHRNVYV